MKPWQSILLNRRESSISKLAHLGSAHGRITFATSQRKDTETRLASLRSKVDQTQASMKDLLATKKDVEDELVGLQKEIDRQRAKLDQATTSYDKSAAKVDTLREATRKTQRTLDKALKEIAGWNDEIVNAGSNRHAVYRKCRLEEIDLPLAKGRLDRVPIEEVGPSGSLADFRTPRWISTTKRRSMLRIGGLSQISMCWMTMRNRWVISRRN